MSGGLIATPARLDAVGAQSHVNEGHASRTASRRDEQNPPSDDSISAYINHTTSSPPEADASDARPSQDGSREHGAHPPSSPSPTPADDEDVAAASGMLSLRASQDSSASRSQVLSQVWRHGRETSAQDGPGFASGRPSDFLVHRDSHDDGDDEALPNMKAGASHDAFLLSLGASSPASAMARTAAAGASQLSSSQLNATDLASRSDSVAPGDDDDEVDELQDPDASQSYDASQMDDEYDTSTGDGKIKKRRRRTKKEEADVLVNVYAQTAFPDSAKRQELATRLGMTTRAISIWFQNRRQAERKRASRFGPAHSAVDVGAHVPRSSATPSRSISLGSSHQPLQRWPSLDAIAASQRSEPRDSPVSDRDGDEMLESAVSQPSFEVLEDKENASPIPRQSVPVIERPVHRQPLRDIRDLVFGQDTLKAGAQPDGDLRENDENDASALYAKRSPFGRSVSSHAALSRPSMDQVVGRSRVRHSSNGVKAKVLNFMSLSTSRRGRASLDGKSSPPAKRPFLRALSERSRLPPALARAISLSEKAEAFTVATEERKQEQRDLLDKMSSSSSNAFSSGPEAADAHQLPHLGGEEDEEQTLRRAANRRLVKAQALGKDLPDRSDAINDLRSRPWARSVSGPSCAPSTLDLAAGRDRSKPSPLAFVQRPPPQPVATKNDDVFAMPKATKQQQQPQRTKKRKSDGTSKSSAASQSKKGRVSSNGDVSLVAPPSSQENIPPTPLQRQHQSPHHFVNGAIGSTPHLVKQAPHGFLSPKGLPSFGTPRNEIGGRRSFGRSVSAQSTLSAHRGAGVEGAHAGMGAALIEDSPSSLRTSAPSSSLSSWATSNSSLPSSLYTSSSATPASHLHRGSMQAPSSTGREMTPRSLAFALGLAHATPSGGGVGGVNGGPVANGAGGGGLSSMMMMSSSRYSTSRYLASSSRDTVNGSARANGGSFGGNGATGAPYSPLARGRQGAMLYAAPTPRAGGGEHHTNGTPAPSYSRNANQPGSAIGEKQRSSSTSSSGSQEGSRGSSEDQDRAATRGPEAPGTVSRNSNGGGRMPFAKVHSQPSMPPPPLFSAASAGSSSQPHGQQQRRLQRLPSLSALATVASDDKENTSSDNDSPRLLPLGALKHKTNGYAAAGESAVGDDSGFVGMSSSSSSSSDIEDGEEGAAKRFKVLAAKAGGGQQSSSSGSAASQGSPTRQRQHDAAQVLLGLAGEGR